MIVQYPVAPILRCPSCGVLARLALGHVCDARVVERFQRERHRSLTLTPTEA